MCTSLTAAYFRHYLCSFCFFRNTDHSCLLLRLLLVPCLPKAICFYFCHCQLQQNPLASWLTSGLYFHLRKTKGCGEELGSLANWVDHRSDTWVMSLTPTYRWWYCLTLYVWLIEQRPFEKQCILKALQLAFLVYYFNDLCGKMVSILFLKSKQ